MPKDDFFSNLKDRLIVDVPPYRVVFSSSGIDAIYQLIKGDHWRSLHPRMHAQARTDALRAALIQIRLNERRNMDDRMDRSSQEAR